jgi:putative endopeptidase
MTRSILNEFKQMLNKNEWMDDISKQKAIEKANYIIPQIGYPDAYDDPIYVATNFNV